MRHALCIGGIFLAAMVFFVPDAQAQFSYSGEGDCNKGIFWPFSRSPGDCLTDTERESGMTGTYRGSEVEEPDSGAEAATPAPAPPQAQQSAPPPAAAAPSGPSSIPNPPQDVASPAAASPAPAAPTTGTTAVQPAAAQSTQPIIDSAIEVNPVDDDRATYTGPSGCTKGIFWPFVRRPGDCLTDAEISSGQTGTYQ